MTGGGLSRQQIPGGGSLQILFWLIFCPQPYRHLSPQSPGDLENGGGAAGCTRLTRGETKSLPTSCTDGASVVDNPTALVGHGGPSGGDLGGPGSLPWGHSLSHLLWTVKLTAMMMLTCAPRHHLSQWPRCPRSCFTAFAQLSNCWERGSDVLTGQHRGAGPEVLKHEAAELGSDPASPPLPRPHSHYHTSDPPSLLPARRPPL